MNNKVEMKDFIVGASNFGRERLDTYIKVRALCPEQDRCALEQLWATDRVRGLMERRRLKFGKAKEVQTALGQSETVKLGNHPGDPVDDSNPCAPRVQLRLGRLSRAESLVNDSCFETCEQRPLTLPSGGVQQLVVRVDAQKEDEAYPVSVEHWSGNKFIGGMTLLFVPPWDPFRCEAAREASAGPAVQPSKTAKS